jgi:tetratricopeptide (TPR) repeat protein
MVPGWKIVYFDYDGVIFLKDIPFNKVWIDRFAIDLKKWQPIPMDLQKLATKRVDPTPLNSRAYLLQNFGLLDIALKELREALKVSPDDAETYRLLGEIYATKKDYRRAFEYIRIAASFRPGSTETRLKLAFAYEQLKDYKGAIVQYERVLENDWKNAKVYFGLARCNARLGKENIALGHLKTAQTLDPEDKIAVKRFHDIMDEIKNPRKPNSKEQEKK